MIGGGCGLPAAFHAGDGIAQEKGEFWREPRQEWSMDSTLWEDAVKVFEAWESISHRVGVGARTKPLQSGVGDFRSRWRVPAFQASDCPSRITGAPGHRLPKVGDPSGPNRSGETSWNPAHVACGAIILKDQRRR